MVHPASFYTGTLRKALLANAAFSLICAVGFLSAGGRPASRVGAP